MYPIPDFLTSGAKARLIPVAADSSKEGRAASILLATLGAVSDFNHSMLGTVGVRVGARAKVACYTEVVFKNSPDGKKIRPDGLIIVGIGKRNWSALVEAKIGKAAVDDEQIRDYVQLAKANGVDAVITLSNQFASLPTHHPVKLPKNLVKGVDLFHWSWMFVLTQATLLLDNDAASSPDQQFILEEMTRYFRHDSVGVSKFDRMNAEWKEVVSTVHSGGKLNKSAPDVENSVASWHQEGRDVSLLMSRRLGRQVMQKLSRVHKDDPSRRLKDDCQHLVTRSTLSCILEIPDTAAPLVIEANLERRTIACSMKIAAPTDKQRSKARINWLLRQLRSAQGERVLIKAIWPGRAHPTQAALEEIREDPDELIGRNTSLTVQSFEIVMIDDLATKFAGPRTFIERLEALVPHYYEQVGQHLKAWVAPPPKLGKTDPVEETETPAFEAPPAQPARPDSSAENTNEEAVSSSSASESPSSDSSEATRQRWPWLRS